MGAKSIKKLAFFCAILALSGILEARDKFGFGGKGAKGVAVVDNPLYTKECASCHFGYQAGLLPSDSWRYIMDTLNNHYGTDASIDDEGVKTTLRDFLMANASETSGYKRSVKITRSLQKGTLYKSLTEIPYLQRKHRKIDKYLIEQKEVRSLARCAACHRDAEKGEYNKRTVNIPNFGAWRD